jgi:hypothetical protein
MGRAGARPRRDPARARGALGGKIPLAASLPGRGELADLAIWRANECARRGVDVRLGVDATAEAVLALAPDAVVVATGGRATKDGSSKFHPMPVPGLRTRRGCSTTRRRSASRRASAASSSCSTRSGTSMAIALSERFAADGREVTLVTPLATPIALDAETLAMALPRAVRAGVRWRPSTALAPRRRPCRAARLRARRRHRDRSGGVGHGRRSGRTAAGRRALARSRAGIGVRLSQSGDAVAVRYADRAIYDGHLAGRAV